MNTGVQTQAPKRYKAARHFANGAVVAGGLTGVGYGLGKGLFVVEASTKSGGRFKAAEVIEKFAKKIFRGLDNITCYHNNPEMLNRVKSRALLFTGAIAGTLALVGAGIYKAGKINGEGN